jgi:hypothetical protein
VSRNQTGQLHAPPQACTLEYSHITTSRTCPVFIKSHKERLDCSDTLVHFVLGQVYALTGSFYEPLCQGLLDMERIFYGKGQRQGIPLFSKGLQPREALHSVFTWTLGGSFL